MRAPTADIDTALGMLRSASREGRAEAARDLALNLAIRADLTPGQKSTLLRHLRHVPPLVGTGADDDLPRGVDPGAGLMPFLLARAAERRGDLDGAARWARLGTERSPHCPFVRLSLTRHLKTLGDEAGAVAALPELATLVTLAPVHLRLFVRLFWQLGRFDDAFGLMAATKEYRRRDPLAVLMVASLDHERGNHAAALAEVETLLPPDVRGRNELQLLAALARCPEAGVAARAARLLDDHLARPVDGAAAADLATRAGEVLARRRAIRPRIAGGGMLVALICPMHREDDMAGALVQLARQTLPGTVPVVAINNSAALTADRVRAAWPGATEPTVLDLGERPNVGAALNAAIAAVDADVYIRLDADCLYFESYAEDMLAALLDDDADLVAKRTRFRYWEETGFLTMMRFDKGRDTANLGGASLGFTRRAWERLRFTEGYRMAEDTSFINAAQAKGMRIAVSDPFNHVSIRGADTGRHTWRAGAIFLSAVPVPVLPIGHWGDIERIARV